MKRILNTLYVTTTGSYLKKEGEAVVVKCKKEVKGRFPLLMLQGIVAFAGIAISPEVMAACTATGVTISYLSLYGRFLARVTGAVSGNVLLRKEQYRISDNPGRAAAIARMIVIGKCANACLVLQRARRDHQGKIDTDNLGRIINKLSASIMRLEKEEVPEIIRGIEGDAARIYFSVFDGLITASKEDFAFAGRKRRPPTDRVNALLSFIYTLLYHDIRSALETCGLDPAVGFLHRDRPGRMSLALDMMEEFRPVFADRLVLSLINLKQVKASDFTGSAGNAVLLSDTARKTVLTTYQSRKQDVIKHPFIGKEMPVGLLFHTQTMLLARYIRGDIEVYPPYFWR